MEKENVMEIYQDSLVMLQKIGVLQHECGDEAAEEEIINIKRAVNLASYLLCNLMMDIE